MITLTKSGNAIVFTFDDNDHYLNDGKIEVPVNSLTLVTDESQMATFKKSATNDIFISARYDELGMSKSDLESWFKENACGSTGGGGGVTSGEVQTMIDESVSGLSDDISTVSGATESLHSAVTELSGQVNTDEKVTANALVDLDNRKLDASAYTPTDLSNYYTKSQTNTQINNATNTLLDAGEFYEYTGSNDERVGDIEDRLSEDEEVTSAALNELNEALSGKQDTLIAGTNITISGNVISAQGGGGGGKAIVAGRGIAVTTGATADTVSFNLPISGLPKTTTAVTDNNLVIFGTGNTVAITAKTGQNLDSNIVYGNNNNLSLKGTNCGLNYNTIFGQNNEVYNTASLNASSNNNFVFGSNNKVYGNNNTHNFLFGDNNQMTSRAHITVFGTGNNPKNQYETIFGKYSVSHSGSTDADKSLFSIGNGTSSAATHNAFEIRQNGDIYITSGGTDIKLQDNLGGGGGGVPESAFTAYTAATEARLAEDEEVTAAALNTLSTALGGFKLVSLTQAQYDALTVKDASTLYIITNVVN